MFYTFKNIVLFKKCLGNLLKIFVVIQNRFIVFASAIALSLKEPEKSQASRNTQSLYPSFTSTPSTALDAPAKEMRKVCYFIKLKNEHFLLLINRLCKRMKFLHSGSGII